MSSLPNFTLITLLIFRADSSTDTSNKKIKMILVKYNYGKYIPISLVDLSLKMTEQGSVLGQININIK